jgi:hypothetical protein
MLMMNKSMTWLYTLINICMYSFLRIINRNVKKINGIVFK